MPTPLATLRVSTKDGALIHVRRHGNLNGPRLVLSHGNGLSVDMYFPFWSLLLRDFDIVAYDFRSHGWNPVSSRRAHNFPTFVRDNEAVLDAIGRKFGAKPAIGVFHSMSAITALLQVQQTGGFAALMLFDPPLRPPAGLPEHMEAIGQKMKSQALRRKHQFKTIKDFARRLRATPVFERVVPGGLDLLASTTLRPAADGKGYELACPREHEAQVYEYMFGWVMQLDMANPPCPTKVVGADPTVPYSFMPSLDLSELVGVDYDFVPDTTHFLMVEEPRQCVDIMLQFLRERGLA